MGWGVALAPHWSTPGLLGVARYQDSLHVLWMAAWGGVSFPLVTAPELHEQPGKLVCQQLRAARECAPFLSQVCAACRRCIHLPPLSAPPPTPPFPTAPLPSSRPLPRVPRTPRPFASLPPPRCSLTFPFHGYCMLLCHVSELGVWKRLRCSPRHRIVSIRKSPAGLEKVT